MEMYLNFTIDRENILVFVDLSMVVCWCDFHKNPIMEDESS